MLKDRKSTKIILLVLVIVLMLIPGFRIFHLRGGLMRESRLTTVSKHYTNLGALHIETKSGNIYIDYNDEMTGVSIEATNASANDGNTSNIILSTIADDIYIKLGKDAVEEIRAESVSGSIYVNDAKLDILDLTTVSGDIEISATEIEKDLTLSSTSGSIDVNGTSSNKLYASVKSGDLDITDSNADNLILTAISGDMDIMDTDAEEVRLNTTSGSITFDSRDEYYLEYSSVSGAVETERGKYKGNGILGNEDSTQKILFKSTSGNLEIL